MKVFSGIGDMGSQGNGGNSRRVALLRGAVNSAAERFEKRWTLRALHRVDPDLSARFWKQRSLYDAAVRGSDMAGLETHGAAMVRGWEAITERMSSEPPDAGDVWLSADEVADLLKSTDPKVRFIIAAKQTFPGGVVA